MTRFDRPRTGLLLCTLVALLVLEWRLEARPGVQVVSLMPKSADSSQIEAALSLELNAPVALQAPPPLLLETLRWFTPDPARDACLATASRLLEQRPALKPAAGVDPHATLFLELLERATDELRRADPASARVSLELAHAILPCTAEPAAKIHLQQLFMTEAKCHFALGNGLEQGPLRDLLAIDPRVELEPEEPAGLRTSFEAARAELLSLAPSSLELPEGGKALIDGVAVTGKLELRPGRHLVQVKGPLGLLKTALVRVGPGERLHLAEVRTAEGPAAEGRTAEGPAFALPEVEEARAAFTRALGGAGLAPEQTAALDWFLTRRGLTRMAFAAPGQGPEEVMLRVYDTGAGLRADDQAHDLRAVPETARPEAAQRSNPGRHGAAQRATGRLRPAKKLNLGRMMFPATAFSPPPALSARLEQVQGLDKGGVCVALLSSGFGAAMFWSFNQLQSRPGALDIVQPNSEPAWLLKGWLSTVRQNSSSLGMPRYGWDALRNTGLFVGARVIGDSRAELSFFGGNGGGSWQTGVRGRF